MERVEGWRHQEWGGEGRVRLWGAWRVEGWEAGSWRMVGDAAISIERRRVGREMALWEARAWRNENRHREAARQTGGGSWAGMGGVVGAQAVGDAPKPCCC